MDKAPVDIAWVVISAGLVFLMQGGFMCLETGLTRSKNSISVAIKNIADIGVSVFLFWLFGFGLMFGLSLCLGTMVHAWTQAQGRVPIMAKILLVEDDEMSRDMLSRRLARRGFEVVIAEDGLQGVDMAQAQQPDLILMDMNLPGLDGWEATRRIKNDGLTQHIPVVALTSYAMEGDREKGLEAGCDDYHTKPVKFGQLLETIDRLLG